MTAQTDLSERCRAIPRLDEIVRDLVIFNVKTFINFMVCKIAPFCGFASLKMLCKNFKMVCKNNNINYI